MSTIRNKPMLMVAVAFVGITLLSGCSGMRGPSPDPKRQPPDEGSLMRAQRVAGQFIDQITDLGVFPEWENARLGDGYASLYRPDIAVPAYFEFDVEPQGFIIVSTGNHDHPVAHWSTQAERPTQRLGTKITGQEDGTLKFFKLDSLSYAAENGAGALIAQLGELPKSMDSSELDLSLGSNFQTMWTPEVDPEGKVRRVNVLTKALDGDLEGQIVGHEVLRPGGQGKEIFDTEQDQVVGNVAMFPVQIEQLKEFSPLGKVHAFESWQALKAEYKESLQHQLNDLRQQAAPAWDSLGENTWRPPILRPGRFQELPLLKPEVVDATVLGAGADYISAQILNQGGDTPTVRLKVDAELPDQQLEVEVVVTYADGSAETLPFSLGSASSLAMPVLKLADGGEWAQRRYLQYGPRTAQNSDWCASGCGATAWAMLYGWADYQALHDPAKWGNHTGIYRDSGGWGEPSVVAPGDPWNWGVVNLTMQIRNLIGTYCSTNQGATVPWRMGDAGWYLWSGRDNSPVFTGWNALSIHNADTLRTTIDTIGRGTPVIIGTGYYSHFPLAYGVLLIPECGCAYLKVNNGWGEVDGEFIPASTWFAGGIVHVP